MWSRKTGSVVAFLCVRWSHHRIFIYELLVSPWIIHGRGLATGNVNIEYVKAASPAFLSLLGQVNGTQCAYIDLQVLKDVIKRLCTHGLKVSRS